MHARLTRFKGSPDTIQQAVDHFSGITAPALQGIPGYLGSTVIVDRGTGSSLVATYWRDAAALEASEEAVRPLRSAALATFGGIAEAPRAYEVAVYERTQPPRADTWARLTTLTGDPAKVDAGIRNFKDTVVPAVKRLRGSRGALLFVDRASGDAVGVTVWESLGDLEASAAAASGLRATAASTIGSAGSPRVEQFEVAFTVAPTAATV